VYGLQWCDVHATLSTTTLSMTQGGMETNNEKQSLDILRASLITPAKVNAQFLPSSIQKRPRNSLPSHHNHQNTWAAQTPVFVLRWPVWLVLLGLSHVGDGKGKGTMREAEGTRLPGLAPTSCDGVRAFHDGPRRHRQQRPAVHPRRAPALPTRTTPPAHPPPAVGRRHLPEPPCCCCHAAAAAAMLLLPTPRLCCCCRHAAASADPPGCAAADAYCPPRGGVRSASPPASRTLCDSSRQSPGGGAHPGLNRGASSQLGAMGTSSQLLDTPSPSSLATELLDAVDASSQLLDADSNSGTVSASDTADDHSPLLLLALSSPLLLLLLSLALGGGPAHENMRAPAPFPADPAAAELGGSGPSSLLYRSPSVSRRIAMRSEHMAQTPLRPRPRGSTANRPAVRDRVFCMWM
jgi:hypothetical protein